MCLCFLLQSHLQEKAEADETRHPDKCMNIYAIDISVSAREHRLQIGGIQIRTFPSECVSVCVGAVEDYRPGST